MARKKILSAKHLQLRTGVTLRATQHDVDTNSEVSRLIDLLKEHERTGDTSTYVLRALFNQLRMDESGSNSFFPAADVAPRVPVQRYAATLNEGAGKQLDQVQVPASNPAVSLPSRPTVAPAPNTAEVLPLQADALVDSLLVRQLEAAPARVASPAPVAPEDGPGKPPKRRMGAGAMSAMSG